MGLKHRFTGRSMQFGDAQAYCLAGAETKQGFWAHVRKAHAVDSASEFNKGE